MMLSYMKIMNLKRYLAFSILLVSVVFLSGCSSSEDAEKLQKEAERKNAADAENAIKQDLLSKYTAIDFEESKYEYTADVQEAMKQGRPFLLEVVVDDIFYKENKEYLKASSTFFSGYALTLEADPEKLKPVTEANEKSEIFPDFFVVANIKNAKKASLKLDVRSPEDSDEIETNFDSPDAFLMEGELLEIKKKP